MKNDVLLETRAGREAFSRRVSEEGNVLLKNENNCLPLKKGEKVAVFGSAQVREIWPAAEQRTKNAGRGLAEAIIENGIDMDTVLYEKYLSWSKDQKVLKYGEWAASPSSPEMPLTLEDVKGTKERGATTAIHIIRRLSSENVDMRIEKGNYLLCDDDINILELLNKEFDKIILILAIGGNIDLEFLEKYNISAVLYTSTYSGISGYGAVADILSGEVNPSGRMTQTLARHFEDYLSSQWFGEHNGGLIQDYHEDIFVGYRYFDTFKKDDCVIFPFGWGLSYTEFELSDITCDITDKVTVGVTVKNIGEMAGKEVIELFFSAPQLSDGAKLSKPLRQFCQFDKTRLLYPGECQRLTISFGIDEMASYDDIGVLGTKSCWVMEKGNYGILLSDNGKDFKNIGSYTEKETRVIEKCHSIETTLDYRILADGSIENLPKPELNRERYNGVSGMAKTELSLSDYYTSDVEEFTSLSSFKKGQKLSLRLLAGSGGGYYLTFKKNGVKVDYNGAVAVTVSDVPVSVDNGAVTLPLGHSTFGIELLKDGFDADTVCFEKVDPKCRIAKEGTSVVYAKDWYEGVIDTNVSNYIDDEGNCGSCLSNLWRRGMIITYKLEIEEAGIYDISFRYCYTDKACALSEKIAFCISNIVQPTGDTMLTPTHVYGEPRHFNTTKPFGCFLPAGTCYLKIGSETPPCPDIESIIITRNDNAVVPGAAVDKDLDKKNATSGVLEHKLIKHTGEERVGIQFEDVYRNPELLEDFLAELNNHELATVVSGTINNITPSGDVGCNLPVFSRGIPAAQTADGPGGLRQQGYSPTHLASPSILCSTFNRELYELFGEATAHECNYYGVDYFLGPSINIFRNPCGGRNSSYFSEDPYLSGVAGVYWTIGLQKHGVAAVVKHYCANNTEFERLKSNSRVSERALREIYMRAFEMSIKLADPWAIMSSYNFANDVKVSANRTLIHDIPRDEWNWEGIFMTDWWNGADAVDEVRAEHDLKMPDGNVDLVEAALNDGSLDRESAVNCARRIVKVLMKLRRVRTYMDTLDNTTKGITPYFE